MMSASTLPMAAAAEKPALMVVGVPHFSNPGRDIANIEVEDVLSASRQHEIDLLVDRLAAFHPTRVAVEWEVGRQNDLDRRYADYRAGRLKLGRNEIDQIGLRLAAKLGLSRIYAVDWLRDPPGKDEDYDFPGWLRRHGRGAEWLSYKDDMQRQADAASMFQRHHPIVDWIRNLNDPAGSRRLAQPYFKIATFGDGGDNPGAAWVGAWYGRNLRIYANILHVGGSPGDRTLVVFGAGHGPLLRSFAAQSGRFELTDVLRYLPPKSRTRKITRSQAAR